MFNFLPKNLEPQGIYSFFQNLWLCAVAVFGALLCYGMLASKLVFAGYAIAGMLLGTVMYFANGMLLKSYRKYLAENTDDSDTPAGTGSST